MTSGVPGELSWPARGSYNDWIYDLDAQHERLKSDAGRLFAAETDSVVRCIEVGKATKRFEDEQSLSTYIDRPRGCSTRIWTIRQSHSLSVLAVSNGMLCSLLAHLNANPAVAAVLHSFGQRTSPSTEGVGAYFSDRDATQNRADYCYVLRSPERHGRDNLEDPFAIRQFAIYERHEIETQKSDFLIINPSATQSLDRRLKTARRDASISDSHVTLHAVFASIAAMKWQEYANYLEQELQDLSVRAHIDPVTEDQQSMMTVAFADIQALHMTHEKLRHAQFMLESNSNVIQKLVEDLVGLPDAPSTPASIAAYFKPGLLELESQVRRVKMLLGRASSLSELINNIISIRTLVALRVNSSETAKIHHLAQEDNYLMVDLAKKAGQDTKTLKTITILTLVYLPASFVSTLLSMGYISINTHGSHVSIDFKPEMLIFLVLTVILLTFTVGLWLVVDRRMKRVYDAKPTGEEEKSSSLV